MGRIEWSPSEKKVARSAYEHALESRLAKLVAEFKAKAAAAATPSDIWDIEKYLREQRRQIDAVFDYRYSQLLWVFAQLILLGYVEEAQLSGLSEEKLETIRRIVSY